MQIYHINRYEYVRPRRTIVQTMTKEIKQRFKAYGCCINIPTELLRWVDNGSAIFRTGFYQITTWNGWRCRYGLREDAYKTFYLIVGVKGGLKGFMAGIDCYINLFLVRVDIAVTLGATWAYLKLRYQASVFSGVVAAVHFSIDLVVLHVYYKMCSQI